MHKPVCVECQIEMKMMKSGVYVGEMFRGYHIYKIWSADLWECPMCHKKVTNGYGQKPLAEHHDQESIRKLKDQIEVRAFETTTDAFVWGKEE
jgi:hypothetical protein